MSNRLVLRVQRDLRDLAKSQEAEAFPVRIELKGDNFKTLTGEITGPPGTPYEGGKFILDIELPDNFPMSPPKIKFVTKVWHPNVSFSDGKICLDTLKGRWAAAMSLGSVMITIQVLLSLGNPEDALNHAVANQYRKSVGLFVRTARHWTNVYAGGPYREEELENKVKQLTDLKWKEIEARETLSMNDWDVDAALASKSSK